MKIKLLFILALMVSFSCFANDTTRQLYNPYASVEKDIPVLLTKAKLEKKHVLLQVGGNWCIWCYKFNSFVQLDSTLKRTISNNYVVYHLNYSKENKNLEYLKKLGNPQRFGFPVFVILDENGFRLHTQDSSLLEKGNGYDFDKVKSFLENWTPKAILPPSEE
ncbi:thioredoxin family protein [Chitinophagaceae bacterium LB-8]|uniref:Thioredoxin family protein n=1 Tax=Paraflavisolibacter caeni TaxID=2982496 RepID=A0A9X3B9Z7_9BACT|nr:thioredoxin family protein [Paraflavisolibacter caeni]MCU7552725.1 thioredoxin family protein [Paraflavisolibacter caeni]